MTVGGTLIVYAIVVGFGGPAGFRRATWPVRAPRLGALVLVAAAWSVPVAFLLAGLTVALPVGALTADLGQMIGACLGRLRAAYATPAGAGFVTAGQVLAAGILLRAGWAVVSVCRRRRDERRRHLTLVRLTARRASDLQALVLDHPGAVAYSVAGRGRAVVVTRGIVDLLSGPELSAVLAHENAHLAARHHRWQTAALLVARALPIVPLLREAPSRVGRLLEMDADERAAAHHEPRVIVSALVAVASAGGRSADSGQGAEGSARRSATAAALSAGRAAAGSAGGSVGRSGATAAARSAGTLADTSMGMSDNVSAGPAATSAIRTVAAPRRSAVGTAAARTAGADAVARVQRLLHPPERLPRTRRVLTHLAVAALTVAPLALAVAPIAVALV